MATCTHPWWSGAGIGYGGAATQGIVRKVVLAAEFAVLALPLGDGG